MTTENRHVIHSLFPTCIGFLYGMVLDGFRYSTQDMTFQFLLSLIFFHRLSRVAKYVSWLLARCLFRLTLAMFRLGFDHGSHDVLAHCIVWWISVYTAMFRICLDGGHVLVRFITRIKKKSIQSRFTQTNHGWSFHFAY
jgi:hypothetical protein